MLPSSPGPKAVSVNLSKVCKKGPQKKNEDGKKGERGPKTRYYSAIGVSTVKKDGESWDIA